MAVFENFPYTNFHDMNMDWLLKKVKELSTQVAEFEELLTSGPVADVKTMVNGVSTSIKNGSGIANLPAASDTTDGVIGLDAVSDDVLRISGAETFDVPILNGGMLSADQVPVSPAAPATSSTFGTVKVGVNNDYLEVTENTGTYQVPRMRGGTVPSNVLPLAAAAQAGTLAVNPNPGIDGVTRIVGQASNDVAKVESGKINASVIPTSGVTAGTYGKAEVSTDINYQIPYFTVDESGRITSAGSNNYAPIMKEFSASIAAGSSSTTITLYGLPSISPGTEGLTSWFNIQGFTPAADMSSDYMKALALGVDFTYTWYASTHSLTITLLNTQSQYSYFRIMGYHLYRSAM